MNNFDSVYSESSQICLDCGICCHGTIFIHDLDPQLYGIPPEPRNQLLPLACLVFSFARNCCLIYEDPDRPLVCKTYQCQLLKRLKHDEITLEQAQSKIKSVKTLLTRILTQIPQSDPPVRANKLIQNAFDSLTLELASGDRSHIDLYMDICSLQLLMSRYIYKVCPGRLKR